MDNINVTKLLEERINNSFLYNICKDFASEYDLEKFKTELHDYLNQLNDDYCYYFDLRAGYVDFGWALINEALKNIDYDKIASMFYKEKNIDDIENIK